MPAKPFVFIDTNIWLYAFLDSGESEKSARARELFQTTEAMLSVQVVNEVCVNLIKKVTAQPVISTSASEEKSCATLRKISRGASRHSK
ncbi:MAG: PIN domain-containing protein [Anaerolineales bacterium]|jgi:predicted nucleic acid-binding protein|nr:PIN domain-containing protein [Chloroflexota bacterium]MBK6644352.1 PIN domain-containing protein [Anaerolineales bacterium]